jgi:hypothetical protein
MKIDHHQAWRLSGLLLALYTLSLDRPAVAGPAEPLSPPSAPMVKESTDQQSNSEILVELFLAPDRRNDLVAITKALDAVSITRVRTQFFRLGHPPENIAIGRDVPAPVARLALHLAVTYNSDVKFLLPEFRFFPDHIVIGSSAYDEKSEIPITPENLARLSDPTLTTTQFHDLYRQLTGEATRLPTYLDR